MAGAVARSTGLTAAIIGVAVLVGWHIGSGALVRLSATWPAMAYNTALALALVGAALCLAASGAPRRGRLLCLIVGIVGGLTLAARALGVDLGIDAFLHDDGVAARGGPRVQMAVQTAITLVILSVGLDLLARGGSRRRRIAAALGAAAASFGVAGVAGIAVGASREMSWTDAGPMAAHTGFAVALLGVGVAALACRRAGPTASSCVRECVAPALGAAGIVLSAVLGIGLVRSQDDAMARSVRRAADVFAAELREDLDERVDDLVRVARRWGAGKDRSRDAWARETTAFIGSQEEFDAVAWFEPGEETPWVVSPAGVDAGEPFGFAGRRGGPVPAEGGKIAAAWTTLVPGKGARLCMVVDPKDPAVPGGRIGCVLDAPTLAGRVAQVQDPDGLHAYRVRDGDREIWRGGASDADVDRRWSERASLDVSGLGWSCVVAPDVRSVAQFRTSLPWLSSAAGLLLSLLVAVAFEFARTSHRRAAELSTKGAQLEAEAEERERAWTACSRSEERYRRFFEDSLAAAYITTPQGRIVDCNPAFVRLFGFASAQAAHEVDMATLYADADDAAARLDELRAGGVIEPRETAMRRRDGSSIHAILGAVAEIDAAGDLVRVKGQILDVTERRQLAERLGQSQKMEALGRLAGGIAHDFNNLLTAISGYSQLLLEEAAPDGPSRGYAGEIVAAADRSARLTHQLLAFSRKQVTQPRAVDCAAVVCELESMLRRVIGEHIDLKTSLCAALGTVRIDPTQLEQVVVNLAVNGRDAMPHGGTLLIEASNVELDADAARACEIAAGPCVMLAVTDTGHGMDEATRARVFEPFFTTKSQGTGLGLATVYGVVKQSGGSVAVYSAPGHGTTVRIYLPRIDVAADTHVGAAPTAQDDAKGSETILLVDDDDSVRELARVVLVRLGYRVLTAGVVEDAVAIAGGEETVDLLLTDIVMPGMSGRDLAECIAVASPGTKVLFISGYTDEAVAVTRSIEAGSAFLQKPFTPRTLARRVRETLDAPSGRRAPRAQAEGPSAARLPPACCSA